MELIARHANDLPALDYFIIKRVNKFCCFNWHLNIGISIGHNDACFEHAIALKHNNCLFKLLRYYVSSQYYPNLINLSYFCAYYDNLEALKDTLANFYIDLNLSNNLIEHAIWGSSFKCLIFCVEKDKRMPPYSTYGPLESTYIELTITHFNLDAVVFRKKNYIAILDKYMRFNGYAKILY